MMKTSEQKAGLKYGTKYGKEPIFAHQSKRMQSIYAINQNTV